MHVRVLHVMMTFGVQVCLGTSANALAKERPKVRLHLVKRDEEGKTQSLLGMPVLALPRQAQRSGRAGGLIRSLDTDVAPSPHLNERTFTCLFSRGS